MSQARPPVMDLSRQHSRSSTRQPISLPSRNSNYNQSRPSSARIQMAMPPAHNVGSGSSMSEYGTEEEECNKVRETTWGGDVPIPMKQIAGLFSSLSKSRICVSHDESAHHHIPHQ